MTTGNIKLNGVIVASGAGDFGTGKASFVKNVTLLANDTIQVLNQSSDTASYIRVSFRATDDTPPVVNLNWPPSPFITDSSSITLIGTVVDQTPCDLRVNGGSWSPADAGFASSFPLPADGPYTARLEFKNSAGLVTNVNVPIVRDTQLPVLTVLRPLANDTTVTDSGLSLSGWWDDLTQTTVTVDDGNIGADTSGTIPHTYPLDMGPNRILVRARDALGHVREITKHVFRRLSNEPAAPDSSQAPPLDYSRFNTFYESVRFIFENTPKRQQFANPDSIVPDLAAVIRGRVLGRDFGPLANVKISVLGHPGYGYAMSRADGAYDLVVNGGYPVTLRFTKQGFMEAQRQVEPPVGDFALVEDVAVIGRTARMTYVDPSAATTASGRFANDANGDRRIKLFFPSGVVAKVAKAPGDTLSFTTFRVRATEYTVGQDGLEAMPAALPPGSAYTYCVELSTDEADSLGHLNGDQIPSTRFTKPISLFVRNFLSLPVGTYVPIGSYDRTGGRWMPEQNGQVVKIVAVDSAAAEIDLTGDNIAETDSTLAYLGYTPPERMQLAAQFVAGDTVWRAQIEHFSAVDPNPNLAQNIAIGSVAGARGGQPLGQVSDACEFYASIIECENRVLGQRIPVVGTPFTLNYRSSRTPGDIASRTLRIATPDSVPSSIDMIVVEVVVAGKTLRDSIQGGSLENQVIEIPWDGRDLYGRRVNRSVDARVSMGFRTKVAYAVTSVGSSFGNGVSTVATLGDATRDRAVGRMRWTRQTVSLGAPSMGSAALGGWTLNPHHYYDLAGRGTLYFGDGGIRFSSQYPFIWEFAGSGDRDSIDARDLAVAPDGSLYIADSFNGRILRIAPNGTQTTIAGSNLGNGSYSGDGSATATRLTQPTGIALGPDGSVYFTMGGEVSGSGCIRVCRVTPGGQIVTIAGTGERPFPYVGTGDGQKATQATFNTLSGIALGPDGSIFVGDRSDKVVRRIWPNGIITRFAGRYPETGGGAQGSIGRADSIQLIGVEDLAVDAEGNLYIAETNSGRIRRVSPDGVMTTFADLNSFLPFQPQSVVLAPDGAMYIGSSTGGRLVRRDVDGTISFVAGNIVAAQSAVGVPALSTSLLKTPGVAVGRQGEIYISQESASGSAGNQIRVIRPDLPSTTPTEIRIPSEDGSEVYAFDRTTGRHLNTRDGVTGAIIYEFTYNTGRLQSIIDASGNATVIVRNAGVPDSIRAPYGQRTKLGVNVHGWLESIRNPNAETHSFVYWDSLGLLRRLTDPRTHQHEFTYDAATGRLETDEDPAGGSQELDYVADGITRTVTRTTGEGLPTSYRVTNYFSGSQRRMVDGPDRDPVHHADSTDAVIRTWFPDGSTTNIRPLPSARFGMLAPNLAMVRDSLPVSGKTRIVEVATTSTGFNPPTTVGDWTESVWVNRSSRPNPFLSSFNSGTRQMVTTTPEGRTTTTEVDAVGRVLSFQVGNLTPEGFDYDGRGRLEEYRQGGRVWTFSYDDSGRVATIVDPLTRATSLRYDAADRLIRQTRPDQQSIGFDYDANGNLTGLKPPGKPTHTFAHSEVDLVSLYTPPSVVGGGATTYAYDLDRRLKTVNRPDSLDVTLEYQAGSGRLDRIVHLRGTNQLGYHTTTGHVTSITSPDTVTVGYAYDGPLLKSETWSGKVNGQVRWAYNADFQPESVSVGSHGVRYNYDHDGLLTSIAGPGGTMSLTRRASDGLVSGTTLGGVTTVSDYTSHGELRFHAARFGADTLYRTSYDRDSLGRITAWHEREGNTLRSREFVYDSTGRLWKVWDRLGNTLIERYRYDLNGNRLAVANNADSVTATYDAQDRLLTFGATRYGYTPSGFMAAETTGTAIKSYRYDALGNLIQVTTPTNTVTYRVDGRNRRVERKANGVVTNRWVWEDAFRIAAEVDAAGAVITRYVYGTQVNVTEYVVRGDSTYRVITDHLGSVRLVVNVATGVIAERAEYDAWGVELGATRAGIVPMGFAGGFTDTLTSLVRCGARDYHAEAAGWSAPDPIRFRSQSSNVFAYVSNTPNLFVDQSGLAQFGTRPLDWWNSWVPPVGPLNDRANTEPRHEQLFYEDGSNDNVGFFDSPDGSGRIGRDDERRLKEFDRRGPHYDDDTMREAERRVRKFWSEYALFGHNCQDFADALRLEYSRIIQERKRNSERKGTDRKRR